MTGTLHIQTLTPTQRLSFETKRALAQKIAKAAHLDSPIECLSASQRAMRPAKPPEPVHVAAAPPVQPSTTASPEPFGSPVNPALSFASFVEGESNQLVLAAAKRALKSPGEFTPLVLHGGPGFGKTHLLQAIANAHKAALYITGDWFNANIISRRDLIASLPYRIILIDDLQNVREHRTRRSLLELMRLMQNRGRQLIVSLDSPPSDLRIDPNIDSRLSGGLVLEVPRPDRDLRYGIMKAAFARAATEIPDGCLSYMADHITGGGRDLEGVVNRLMAAGALLGATIDIGLVTKVVQDLVRPQNPQPAIHEIQRVICRSYNVSRVDLCSARRTANIVRPRQLAMYLAKKLTLRSLPEIGRRFGGRDHTTVLHAVRKMEALVAKDAALSDEVELLKRQLDEAAR